MSFEWSLVHTVVSISPQSLCKRGSAGGWGMGASGLGWAGTKDPHLRRRTDTFMTVSPRPVYHRVTRSGSGWAVCEREGGGKFVEGWWFFFFWTEGGGEGIGWWPMVDAQRSSIKIIPRSERNQRAPPQRHSHPLSLIMWASSMMNFPSLYFWLLSKACS